MDYEHIKTVAIEIFEQAEKYVEMVNWFYIGVGIFMFLLFRYILDGLKGSTVSPVFLIGVVAALAALLYLVMMIVPGLNV
jgi:hypothetical protein